MKRVVWMFLLAAFLALVGCSGGKTKFSYWQGGVTSEFYVYVDSDSVYYKITGYPYLVMEYDTVSNRPINAVFGMSSYVRETVYDGSQDDLPVVPPVGPPVATSGEFRYEDEFTFSGTVVEIISWRAVETHDEFSVGLWSFWFELGEEYNLEFAFDTAAMMGEFNNANPTWDSFGSLATNSIKMVYLKTNNGY